MKIEEIYNIVKTWIDSHNNHQSQGLFKKVYGDKDILDSLILYTDYLPKDSLIHRRIWHILNKVNSIPKCRICNKEVNYISFIIGYATYCSKSCTSKQKWNDGTMQKIVSKRTESLKKSCSKGGDLYEKTIEKRKKTCNKKYGVDYVMQNEGVKDIYRKNSIDNYGVDWVSKSDMVIDKIKNTWENKDNLEEINIKRSKNHIKSVVNKYGVKSVFEVKDVRDKIDDTNIKNIGVKYPFQSKEVRDKSKKTNIDRFGYENAMSNEEIQKKNFESCLNYKEFEFPSGNIEKVQGDAPLVLNILLKEYKEDDIDVEWNCPKINYLDEEGINHSYRPDIYIKTLNKIIEVKNIFLFASNPDKIFRKIKYTLNCGYDYELWLTHNNKYMVFYFSNSCINNNLFDSYTDCNVFSSKDFMYFFDKKLLVFIQDINIKNHKSFFYTIQSVIQKNKKYTFLNIFSDLVDNKFETIKSKIDYIIRKNAIKVYARRCEIKEIGINKEYIDFVDMYHLKGNINSKIKLGLYYCDELVSIMSFGGLRKSLGSVSEPDSYELLRFCSKGGYNVVGAASRLLKHFIKLYNPKSIVSYADRNWSDGKLYETIGFIKDSITESNYYWVVGDKRYHRFVYRKDMLVKRGYDVNKTEQEIMEELGHHKIYDCGSIKYVMQNL